ncbi:MAG TPA: cell division protein FtsL [Candidatus Margulisiibacteriota bacterium]|nr:cell division protein FtsL [Candidatus Margulisiibacteriota bacterium]
MGQSSPQSSARRDLQRSLAGLRPANIAASTTAEARALFTWLAIFVVLGVAIALAHVWLRLKVTDLGYVLSTTHQVIQKLEWEQQELTAEVARLDAPDRLEEAARVRLGMTYPQRGQEAVLP